MRSRSAIVPHPGGDCDGYVKDGLCAYGQASEERTGVIALLLDIALQDGDLGDIIGL